MRHRYFLLAQVLTIVAVMAIFRLVPDRKIAATIAGFLFLAVPIAFLVRDFRHAKKGERLQLMVRFSVLQFLVLFAIPIFWARVFHWNMEFSDIDVLGVPAALLHRFSNASYMVMLLATFSKVAADFIDARVAARAVAAGKAPGAVKGD